MKCIYILLILMILIQPVLAKNIETYVDVDIPADYQRILTGEDVLANVRINIPMLELEQDRTDIKLITNLIDDQGNVIKIGEQSLAISKYLDKVVRFKVLDHMRPGTYKLQVKVIGENIDAVGTSSFKIYEKQYIEFDTNLITMITAFIVISILLYYNSKVNKLVKSINKVEEKDLEEFIK